MEFLDYVSWHLKNCALGITNHFTKGNDGHILKYGPHPPVSKIVNAPAILSRGGGSIF